jgi:hypothetical protein
VQATPRQLRKREQDCYNTVEKEETRRQKKGASSLTCSLQSTTLREQLCVLFELLFAAEAQLLSSSCE